MKGKGNLKKIWQRNQIMITALALMIAVAGYLNFTGKEIGDEIAVTGSAQFEEAAIDAEEPEVAQNNPGTFDISDADIEEYAEIESLDSDADMAAADIPVTDMENGGEFENDEENEIPGEAVFTSGTGITSLASANLLKEQTRAKNRETLMAVINNVNLSESVKQDAVNSMIALTDISEKECNAEILLEAKGFKQAVVSISGDTADVMIGVNELDDAQRAQIEDIVKRKTGIGAENIIISPVGEK